MALGLQLEYEFDERKNEYNLIFNDSEYLKSKFSKRSDSRRVVYEFLKDYSETDESIANLSKKYEISEYQAKKLVNIANKNISSEGFVKRSVKNKVSSSLKKNYSGKTLDSEIEEKYTKYELNPAQFRKIIDYSSRKIPFVDRQSFYAKSGILERKIAKEYEIERIDSDNLIILGEEDIEVGIANAIGYSLFEIQENFPEYTPEKTKEIARKTQNLVSKGDYKTHKKLKELIIESPKERREKIFEYVLQNSDTFNQHKYRSMLIEIKNEEKKIYEQRERKDLQLRDASKEFFESFNLEQIVKANPQLEKKDIIDASTLMLNSVILYVTQKKMDIRGVQNYSIDFEKETGFSYEEAKEIYKKIYGKKIPLENFNTNLLGIHSKSKNNSGIEKEISKENERTLVQMIYCEGFPKLKKRETKEKDSILKKIYKIIQKII